MTILEVKHLSLAYINNQAKVTHGALASQEQATIIFSDLNFSIKEGEQISLVGKSGNGKSSLLYLLAGFEKVPEDTIYWRGKDLAKMSAKEINALRNQEIGFIFQFHNLLPDFNALENVLLPAQIGKADLKQARKRAQELLEYMGLGERMHHFPDQLSGGERQRVAIARSLINNPKIILADEPTGNLDQETSNEVMALIHRINQDFATSILLVTHDLNIAQSLPIRWHLDKGRLLNYA
ncbi:hypothetical protein CKF54_06460 [Psittacicella hinzii]|uniref:ABC transporter domain-containing protein n=1 Tax=Psittacicella hinzii TaxID=2028575 RepID=A0A3A1Y1W9_9GAMM|nr:ABC transporter ATP-binding protein [Psittacicella hinzii]RIY31555.1 hypothetical protein CKF54_06460 [Psittacicella hinzii]